MKKIIISFLMCLATLFVVGQDPFVTKQKISNPRTQAEANGALSVFGPMWSLMTDTIHAYAIPKYKGALIMRHADSLIYANTGEYWRCVEQPFPVEFPLYVDYSDPAYPRGILKSASGDVANKLLRTGGITLNTNTVTVAPDIIWVFSSQVKVQDVQSQFTVNNATSGYKRVDIIYIDSLDNMHIATGTEDTAFVFPPSIDYNAITVTTISVEGSSITIDPVATTDFWSVKGNTSNSSFVFGSNNAVPVRHIYNGKDIITVDDDVIINPSLSPSVGVEQDSRGLKFGGKLGAATRNALIRLDVDASGDALTFSLPGAVTGFYNFSEGSGGGSILRLGGNAQIWGGTRLDLFNTSFSQGGRFYNSAKQTSGQLFRIGNRGISDNIRDYFSMNFDGRSKFEDSATTTFQTSAMLELISTSKCLLLTRMTQTQRNTMTAVDGMITYQTDNTPGFYGYVNGAWMSLSGGGSSLPYTEYAANVTDNTGTLVTTVLSNTLGFTPTISTDGNGSYTVTFNSSVNPSKVQVSVGAGYNTTNDDYINETRISWGELSSSDFKFKVYVTGAGFSGDILENCPLQIRIYP